MSGIYESAFDFGLKLLWTQGLLRDAQKRIADLKMARRVVKYAIALMKSGRTGGEPKEGHNVNNL